MRVLFICTGNTCRSPMAEALLKHYVPDIEVKSAGIYAIDGQQANKYSIAVLQERDIKLEHQSLSVTNELLEWADVVLTMTTSHKSMLAIEFPGFQHKISSLIEFAYPNVTSAESKKDIADPFGLSIEVYSETLEQLDVCIQQLIDKLQ